MTTWINSNIFYRATFLDWLAHNRYAKLKAKQADADQVNTAATPNEEQSTTT